MPDKQRLEKPITIYSRSRPFRIAYLINESEHFSIFLDCIFAEAYSRWGGKHTLIVPVLDDKIDSQYWAWLKWYDPDMIYSYAGINEELIHKIHRDIQPISFQNHEILGEFNGHHSGRPDLEIRPLTSTSILPYLRQQQNIFTIYPRKLLNRFPEWHDDGFIGDNFGTCYDSFGGFPIDSGIRDYLEPLNLAPPNASEFRYLNPGSIVESEIALLEDETITSLSKLSAVNSDYPGLRNHPWSRVFNIVVGDNFIDRISFWNGRLLLEGWQNEHMSALRIPKARLENEDFINKLGPYITRWNRRASAGQSGPNYITIRSHSVSEETLNEFAEKLRAATNDVVNIEKLKDDTDCCPEDKFFKERHSSIDNLFRNHISEKIALVDFPFPKHLSDTGNIPPRFRIGKWIVEQKIQHHNDFSIYSNIQHWWKLPRREGVISLFTDSLQGRVTLEGCLAIPVGYDKQKIKIMLPEDKDFFKAILHYGNNFSPRDLRFSVFKPPIFEFSRLSEKGRYLNGVLGLFKGLNNAFDMISCTYWRNVFIDLSDPNRSRDITDEAEIIKKLKRELNVGGNKSFAIKSDEDWQGLARVALLQAKKLRQPRNITDLKKLSSKWCEKLERFIAQNTRQVNNDESIIKEWQENLESSLQSLCSSGVFVQGYQWSCEKCGHKNWMSVDMLTLTPECNVCRNKAQIPVNFDWSFYLNDFFSASIREHGTLPVIWALGKINHQSNDSFFFSPQLDLFTSYPESKKSQPSGEVDLICVSDGKLIIGEVKSSVRDFNDKEAAKLINLAKALHPDIVYIACFERNSNALNTKINKIRDELTSFNCKVVLLEPDNYFEEDDNYLPMLND